MIPLRWSHPPPPDAEAIWTCFAQMLIIWPWNIQIWHAKSSTVLFLDQAQTSRYVSEIQYKCLRYSDIDLQTKIQSKLFVKARREPELFPFLMCVVYKRFWRSSGRYSRKQSEVSPLTPTGQTTASPVISRRNVSLQTALLFIAAPSHAGPLHPGLRVWY